MNRHVYLLVVAMTIQASNGLPQLQTQVIRPGTTMQTQPPQHVQQFPPQPLSLALGQLFLDLLNYKIGWLNQMTGSNAPVSTGYPFLTTLVSSLSGVAPQVMSSATIPMQGQVMPVPQLQQGYPQQPYQNYAPLQVPPNPLGYPQQAYQNYGSPQVLPGPQVYPQQSYQNYVYPQVAPGPQGYPQQGYQYQSPPQVAPGLQGYPQQGYQYQSPPQVAPGLPGYPQQPNQNNNPSQVPYHSHQQEPVPTNQNHPQPGMSQQPPQTAPIMSQKPPQTAPIMSQQPPQATPVDPNVNQLGFFLHKRPTTLPVPSDIDISTVDLSAFEIEPHLQPRPPGAENIVLRPTSSAQSPPVPPQNVPGAQPQPQFVLHDRPTTPPIPSDVDISTVDLSPFQVEPHLQPRPPGGGENIVFRPPASAQSPPVPPQNVPGAQPPPQFVLHDRPTTPPVPSDVDISTVDLSTFQVEPHLQPRPPGGGENIVFRPPSAAQPPPVPPQTVPGARPPPTSQQPNVSQQLPSSQVPPAVQPVPISQQPGTASPPSLSTDNFEDYRK